MNKTLVILVVLLLITQILAQCQKKPSANGEACSNGGSCLSTICTNSKCAAINLVAANAACDSDFTSYLLGAITLSPKKFTCGAGLYCNGYVNIIISEKMGTCTVMPKLGETCNDQIPCIGGFCANATKVCTPYRSGAKDSGCTSNADCQQNLKCSSNKCVDASKEGEACTDDRSCMNGLTCTTEKKCAKFVGSGGTCDDKTLVCENYYFCDSTKKCAPFYSKGEGNVCSNTIASGVQCSAGLYCKGGQCLKPGPNCTSDGCAGFGQVCECPTTSGGAGTCVGSSYNAATFYSTIAEVYNGNRNLIWAYCQTIKTIPSGYMDPVIVNLICTASASAIKTSFILLAAVFTLLFGLLY